VKLEINIKKRFKLGAAVLCFTAVLASGCSNIGNAPQGPDPAQVQAEFSKQDPQKQIQGIQYAPIPAAEKEKKIEEIEKKYGIKRGEAPAQKGGLPAGG